MLPTLERSDRFRTEVKSYQDRISKISNEKLKTDLNDLLKKLILEVKILDNQHRDIFEKNQKPTNVNDSRNSIVEIRKKINKFLDDYDKAQKNN